MKNLGNISLIFFFFFFLINNIFIYFFEYFFYSSKSLKFRIPIPVMDESHNPKKLEEDRGHTIEAAIVRIMKARKTLTHQQLIAEVLTQLSFFRPDAKVISLYFLYNLFYL